MSKLKPLLHTIALLVMLALGYAWHVSGIGMNETVTSIGYGVIALITLLAIDEIEEGLGDVG